MTAVSGLTQTNGTCGNNLIWIFDSGTGKLIIRGTGEMFDYQGYPWGEIYSEKIIQVEIEDGVTHIGDYAFGNCYNMTSITIPNSVISIGKSVF
jgi:hypothetical protein